MSLIRGSANELDIARRDADGSWAPAARIAQPAYPEATFANGLAGAVAADGTTLAAWSIDRETPNGLGGILGSRVVASIAPPGAAFGVPAPLTIESHFSRPSVAASGTESFVATATPHGPVVLATYGPRGRRTTTLSPRGDGDAVLAAGGARVLAAYQRDDRIRLVTVR